MKTIEQKIEQCRKWQKAARERAIARQREKLADPAWRESQYQKMRNTIDRRIAKQKERPPASKTRKSAVKIKSRDLKGRTPTAEERRIANALGALPCIACYMHGVISEEVSLHHISGRTAPGCHKKQLPLCRWHHQHAAPAEVREKYPWLVPVHADGVVGGKKEFTLLNKSEMELLADAYERGLTLSGTKTHVKQRFLPLTPLLMVSDVLWSPVLPA